MLKFFYCNILLNILFCKQAISHFLDNKKILLAEKKKMQNEDIYNSSLDLNLFLEKQFCKKLCYDYNNISPEKMVKRGKLINKILGKTGKVFLIEQPFMCDYGYNIEIGENFCSSHNLLILDPAKVKFGKNVFIGPNCGFYTSCHPLDSQKRNKGFGSAKPITVGNNVWIGGNVTVLPGVTIGDNVVVGAGSIVKYDIPSNTLAVGNPCQKIKELY